MNIRPAAIAINQTPLDWEGNYLRVKDAIHLARKEGATLICLPELCLTGYGCEDAFFSPHTSHRAWQMLEELLPETHNIAIAVGLPVFHQRAIYNVSALLANGNILGLVAKKNLAGDGLHYESRWFKPWPEGAADTYYSSNGQKIPIGDLVFDLGGVRIGFEICEDAWVAGRPGVKLATRAVDVILNPSASHFAFGKAEIRRRFVAEGSRSFGVIYVYSNLLGNEAGRVIYDGQLLIAEQGNIIAESPRFGFNDVRILTTDVDVTAGRITYSQNINYRPALPANNDLDCIHADFSWPDLPPAMRGPSLYDHDEDSKEEEFTRAICLGLFDYLRKNHSDGYVVSLSGGADSAAVACLVRLMYDFAMNEIGDVLRKQDLFTSFPSILLTVYQPTENSGAITQHAAVTLAKALETTHLQLDLTEIHHSYIDLVEKALGQPLTWQHHDIPLQNIQARVRAPGAWMLANLRNAILLTTSNRSEAAVGYATMDGDTAGGLAPIAGIDKAFLLHWLKWLESTGPLINGKRRPIPELVVITSLKPTAELRPSDANQTDESDLMPYPVLDFIERCVIRDRKSPAEVLSLLTSHFHEYDHDQHLTWTKRFFILWSRNQWKRERYAPSFHLDDESLDPKTWCRWPILSGSFKEELHNLH